MPVNYEDILAAPDTDESEFPWCLCKENCGGTMIFCDNPSCPKGEWFHIDCLDLSEEVNFIKHYILKFYISTNRLQILQIYK